MIYSITAVVDIGYWNINIGYRNLIYQNNKNVSAYKYISREQAGYSIVMREVNVSTLLTTSNSVLG